MFFSELYYWYTCHAHLRKFLLNTAACSGICWWERVKVTHCLK